MRGWPGKSHGDPGPRRPGSSPSPPLARAGFKTRGCSWPRHRRPERGASGQGRRVPRSTEPRHQSHPHRKPFPNGGPFVFECVGVGASSMLMARTGVGLARGGKNQRSVGSCVLPPKAKAPENPFHLARGSRGGRGGGGGRRALQASGPGAANLRGRSAGRPGSAPATQSPCPQPESGDAPSPLPANLPEPGGPEARRPRLDGGKAGSGASPGRAEFSLRQRQRGGGVGRGPGPPGPQSR